MTRCKTCGGDIAFTKINSGWFAVELNGEPHWRSCKARLAATRKPEVRKGARITGPGYQPSCGQCAVPPWEECACSNAEVTPLLLPLPERYTDLFNTEAEERLRLLLA